MIPEATKPSFTERMQQKYADLKAKPGQMRTVHNLKFIVLGDRGVGKTYLCEALPYNKAVKISSGLVQVSADEQVKVELHDSVDNHLPPSFLKGAIAALLVYEVSSRESFDGVREWFQRAVEIASSQMLILMVAMNKNGIDRAVPTSEGQGLANELGLLHFDVSERWESLNVIEFAVKDIFTGVQSGKF